MADDKERRFASDEDAEITQNLLAVRNNIDEILARIEGKLTEIPSRAGLARFPTILVFRGFGPFDVDVPILLDKVGSTKDSPSHEAFSASGRHLRFAA